MVLLTSEKLSLELNISRIRDLIKHERTLVYQIDKLSLKFQKWAKLENPIIVEKNNIVIDGNHRVKVFEKLGFKHIPVCKIDYFNEKIKLKSWFRIIKNVNGFENLEEKLTNSNCKIVHLSDKNELKNKLKTNWRSFGLLINKDFMYISLKEESIKDCVDLFNFLEHFQDEISIEKKLEYFPDKYIKENNFFKNLRPDDLIIWTPRVKKRIVVKTGLEGKIFPPKSTRHIIPFRPINLNIPIRWLREDITSEEINKRFFNYLEKKNITRFGPGMVINGRYYEEELFVFSDKSKIKRG